MIVRQKQIWLLFSFVASLLILSLTMAGCGSTPTPKPQLTFALEVSPGAEVQVGKDVAIVAKVEPLEKLDLKWSVSGTAGGKLNTDTGEQVIYTAGKEGTDIVVAEGTTASGVPVKQTVTLTVVGEPVAQTTCRITEPKEEDDDLGHENEVKATCSDVPDYLCISVLVYSHQDSRYYPQPGPIKMGSGDYEGRVYLGEPTEGIEDEFDIIVALADEDVSGTLRQDAATYSSYGFTLPDGVEEKDRITVTRGQ